MPQAEITKLSPSQEARFRQWVQANRITDVDQPGSFYDYRGYWKEYGDKPINFGIDHFTDTYKQHGHPTFSIESKYSQGPDDGGRWVGERFVPPPGRSLAEMGQSLLQPMESHAPTAPPPGSLMSLADLAALALVKRR